jgi:hypothetical protein
MVNEAVVSREESMQANLEWINQEWRRWLESEQGKKTVPHGYKVKEHPEHVAKLFAAFCLDRLRLESEALDNVG